MTERDKQTANYLWQFRRHFICCGLIHL